MSPTQVPSRKSVYYWDLDSTTAPKTEVSTIIGGNQIYGSSNFTQGIVGNQIYGQSNFAQGLSSVLYASQSMKVPGVSSNALIVTTTAGELAVASTSAADIRSHVYDLCITGTLSAGSMTKLLVERSSMLAGLRATSSDTVIMANTSSNNAFVQLPVAQGGIEAGALHIHANFSPAGFEYLVSPERALFGRSADQFSVRTFNTSTGPEPTPTGLEDKVSSILSDARQEHFEDGLESRFSRDLTRLIRMEGRAAVQALIDLLPNASPDVVGEALRRIGEIDHPASHNQRRWLLEFGLHSASPLVRDAAVLGLASLRDPHAIRPLLDAIVREKIKPLRADMEELVRDLAQEVVSRAS